LASNVRTTTRVEFSKHESLITKGEVIALKGWWHAADECVKKCDGNASAYARLAAKQARKNTEGTIRVFVGAVRRAQEMGYTLDYFVSNDLGIEHVRATVAGKGERKAGVKVSKVSMPTERAEKAVRGMNRLELKATIKAAQAALKALDRKN